MDYEIPPSDAALQKLGLTAGDLNNLLDSFITPRLAMRAGIIRRDSFDAHCDLGKKPSALYDLSGLRFTFVWPGENRAREHVIRLDNPIGKTKYLMPFGTRSKFYLPPDVNPTWLDDPGIPIVFVEGQKKCLAMWRVACLNPFPDGRPCFIPIGLIGVWGHRSKLGFKQDAGGKREEREKGPCADFDRIEWKGRLVYVLFDTNIHFNPKVMAACDALGDHLVTLGAQVMIAKLPSNFKKNGPDDYAATYGDKAILEVLHDAQQHEPKKIRQAKRAAFVTAIFNDLFNLMAAEWGWSDEERITYLALNSSWGFRKQQTFRAYFITIARRIEKLSDVLSSADKKRAERHVSERIKRLKATIERTVSFPLLEKLDRGGKIDPKTGKRLGSQFRLNALPFLQAYDLYIEKMEAGEKIPGKAREEAAREIASQYAVSRYESERIEAEQARLEAESKKKEEIDEDDIIGLQIAFEKKLQKEMRLLRAAMVAAQKTKTEIAIYFSQIGYKVKEFGKTQKQQQARKLQQFKREKSRSYSDEDENFKIPQVILESLNKPTLGTCTDTQKSVSCSNGDQLRDFPVSDDDWVIEIEDDISPVTTPDNVSVSYSLHDKDLRDISDSDPIVIDDQQDSPPDIIEFPPEAKGPNREQITDRGYRGPCLWFAHDGDIPCMTVSYAGEEGGAHWINLRRIGESGSVFAAPLSQLYYPDENFAADAELIEQWRKARMS